MVVQRRLRSGPCFGGWGAGPQAPPGARNRPFHRSLDRERTLAAAPLGAVVQALRGHDYQPWLAHKLIAKHSTVLRGQVACPAVMRPLPLYSGRNLPLGLRCPSHCTLGGTRWGLLRTKEREIIKEYIKTQIIAMF